MFNHAPLDGVCCLILVLATTAASADTLVLVTNQADQGANDSVAWSQLGADGTKLGSSFTGTSANAVTVAINLVGPDSVTSVVCSATPCSWTGTGFTAADTLIWASDAANGGNGPLTLNFGTSVSGAGALIQADGPGQFTAQIEAFNGSTSLRSFTVTSNANGDGLYIGLFDQTGPNITSVVFSLTNCIGNCTDFALDTAYVNAPAATNLALAVSLSGTGSGTVTSNPHGIECPGTCSARFSSGTTVTLTATPVSGFVFAGWSGACSGVSSSCSVFMSTAKGLTAIFNIVTATNTTLNASASQVPVGASVTFTAQVAPMSGRGTPSGTVAFNDGPTTLGSGTLNASGVATYTTSTLTVGQHSITAVYSGDASDAGSTSVAFTEVVNAADFSLSANPTSAIIAAGQSGTFTLTVTPQGAFTSPINFSCSGLPALAGCTFDPASVTPNTSIVNTTLTVTTAAHSAALTPPPLGRRQSFLYSMWFAIPAMLLGSALAAPKHNRKLLSYCLAFLLVGGCLLQVACGGRSSSVGGGGGGTAGGTGGTPGGTHTITVTGTGASTQHTATATLIVQ